MDTKTDAKEKKIVLLATAGKTKEQIKKELIALARKAGILKSTPKPEPDEQK